MISTLEVAGDQLTEKVSAVNAGNAELELQKSTLERLLKQLQSEGVRTMDIFIKTLTGETYTLSIEPETSMQQLKAMIQDKKATLTCAGKPMHGGTAADNNLQHFTTLFEGPVRPGGVKIVKKMMKSDSVASGVKHNVMQKVLKSHGMEETAPDEVPALAGIMSAIRAKVGKMSKSNKDTGDAILRAIKQLKDEDLEELQTALLSKTSSEKQNDRLIAIAYLVCPTISGIDTMIENLQYKKADVLSYIAELLMLEYGMQKASNHVFNLEMLKLQVVRQIAYRKGLECGTDGSTPASSTSAAAADADEEVESRCWMG